MSVLLTCESFKGVSYLEMIDQAELRHVVVLDGDGYTAMLRGGKQVPESAAEERAAAVRPDDLCELLATSGTTGAPKAVMLDHRQILRGYLEWSAIVTLRAGDRYPVVSPFSHGFGINAGLLACLMRGATMIPVAVFDPDLLMDRFDALGVTVIAGPPALFQRLLAVRPDAASLRVAICGAAAVPPDLVRALLRAGVRRVINAYGLIEGTVVSMTRDDDPVETIAGTAGRAIPGMEIAIAADDGTRLPAGERGEILVRGHGVMRGYWRDPDRTGEAVDADGWLRTGDVGVLDDRGNVTIVDRKKDVFIVGGFSAYPAEIEALLLRHDAIAQAAVVAVPDADLGEVGWAYVVPREGADPGDLTAWARANMSGYKVPRRFVLVDALPVNPNGKIDKPDLRQRSMRALMR